MSTSDATIAGDGPLPSTGSAAGGAPHCAVHPEVVARPSPCERCGSFACEACFGDLRSELCASCRARAGQVAWEAPGVGMVQRLVDTCRAALTEPVLTFERIGVGELGPPATFSALALAIGYAPLLLCLPVAMAVFGLQLTEIDGGRSSEIAEMLPLMLIGMLVGLPIWTVVMHTVIAIYYGVVFHGVAKLLGGHGTFASSLRGVLYTNAIFPLSAVVMVVAWIPLIGSLFNFGWQVVKLIWSGVALTGTAIGAHGLSRERAMIAGHAPGVGLVLLFVTTLALAMTWLFAMMPALRD